MHRLFVEQKMDDSFILSKENLLHIKSIRLRDNEKFICVYDGEFYVCKLDKNNRAIILEKLNENHEYEHELVLFAAIINIKRFEWLIQKATELGVKKFYPLITKNTNIKYIQSIKDKISRFQLISKNAAEQSFRNKAMIIENPINFVDSLDYKIDKKYLAHEKTTKNDFDLAFEGNLAFYVGPEGGFTEEEVEMAVKKNINIVSLGKRILRSETSSIFLLSNIKV